LQNYAIFEKKLGNMIWEYALVIVGAVFMLLGLVGCILPIIPGPPLSWIGIILLALTHFADYSWQFIVITGIVVLVVTILDYVFPAWFTRKLGGTKYGVYGSIIGLVIGLIFFPPIGIIVGPFAGAYIGEVIGNRNLENNKNNPLLSATGSFLGFLLGTGMKFAVSGYLTYRFFVDVFF